VDQFGSFMIQQRRLTWPDFLPGLDGFAYDRVYRLHKGRAGLVHRHIQKADSRRRTVAFGGFLPANGADPQPRNIVRAKAAE
jgi:hypothetical protein